MKPCVFINLPAAEDRRRSVELSFAATAPSDWALSRFPAFGPADVANLAGSLSAKEKGCFASHRAALGQYLEGDGPIFIAEDDVVFAAQTFGVLDALMNQGDWDVLYTDAALCDLAAMVQLARRRDAMRRKGEYLAVNLAGRSYFGATAYAVRGSAKRRLHAALSAASDLNQPYDLVLRDLCHSGRFKMAVCFPFLTTVSAYADASQIQHDGDVFDTTLNAYRRLMYVDRDLDQCDRDGARLRAANGDETARRVGDIFAAIASPAFPLDR